MVIAWLIGFSWLGILIRQGLIAIFPFGYTQSLGLFYAQLLGCLIAGWVRQAEAAWLLTVNPKLLIGILTGLCGSLTTFSSWMVLNHSSLNEGTVLLTITDLITTLGMGIIMFQLGDRIGRKLHSSRESTMVADSTENQEEIVLEDCPSMERIHETDTQGQTANINHETFPCLASCLSSGLWPSVIIGLGCCLILILCPLLLWMFPPVSSPFPFWNELLVDFIVGPIGTLIRWRLGAWNQLPNEDTEYPVGGHHWYKVIRGTFVANMTGTLIAGIAQTLIWRVPMSMIALLMLRGILSGFCGCLTTLSSFVVELQCTLKYRAAWKYGIISVFTAQMLLLFTLGIPYWTAS